MKVWYFVLYALYLLFGCFTLALMFNETVGLIMGGVWGAIVANDALKRFSGR